jgi:flagellar assembly factor FliW
MSINLTSTRFGSLAIDPSAAIEFPDGLIGFGGQRFTLLATTPAPDAPFLWLHSLDEPALALPVTNPHRFFPQFRLEVLEDDAERLGIEGKVSVDVYVTVRAAPRLADVVANQRAPIVVHRGRGAQLINQAPGMDLRAPLFLPEILASMESAPAAA